MANIADDTTQQLLRTIVRDETADLRVVIHDETTKLRTDIQVIVHEETADLRADITTVKEILGSQSLSLRSLQTDVGSLKTSHRAQVKELHRLAVLFEDLDDRFTTVTEIK